MIVWGGVLQFVAQLLHKGCFQNSKVLEALGITFLFSFTQQVSVEPLVCIRPWDRHWVYTLDFSCQNTRSVPSQNLKIW